MKTGYLLDCDITILNINSSNASILYNYCKSKSASTYLMTLNLLESYGLLLLLHGTEAINPNKSETSKLNNLINIEVVKICNTCNSPAIEDIIDRILVYMILQT